jgi:signal transduction histidine kinase
VETRVSVIRENDGSISGYIGLTHDITERKQTENELIRIKEDLERSKNHLNIALENANTGVWEWNLVVNEIRFDERIEKMFNIIPGSFHNTPEDFGELVHEEDTERVYGTVQNAIINDIPFEAVFRTRSAQTPRYLSARANIIKDKDGNKVSLIGVCFDVTGMMERYNQLITKLNEDLLKSNKELESFAYVASHDLQEPLRMVTSFTQLLQLRYHNKLDEDADTYINYAVDGSKRMYDLINGLLAYSRVNTRQKEFSQVDMNMVAEHAQENLKLRIEEKQAVIKCNKLPLIRADQNQMVQLLQNLIENGIKFSDRQPLITISANPENDHYVFSVSDNGIGIEKQYFERIFRIFQRLHLRDKYGGTGIGLSVCQRIVERHKGKIWVESEPGKGSTFLFTIPK